MARAPSNTVLSSAGLAGLQISVATRDIRREFASGK
jgi:small-conductance mechanosensitive channel